MSTLLIRRRRPFGDPAIGRLHDGGAGAGRIVHSVGEAGVALADVGIQQLLLDPDALLASAAGIVPAGSFDRVILGSHLVNIPDADLRIGLLELAGTATEDKGLVLVEHHPIDWLATAADVPATPGGSVGMIEVRVDPPFLAAVSVLDAGGRVVRQPFRARVLSEVELDDALAAAGLRRTRRLGPTWIEAGAVRGSWNQRVD